MIIAVSCICFCVCVHGTGAPEQAFIAIPHYEQPEYVFILHLQIYSVKMQKKKISADVKLHQLALAGKTITRCKLHLTGVRGLIMTITTTVIMLMVIRDQKFRY